MFTLVQMVCQGYHLGAPSQEAEDIDAQVAERQRCPKCEESTHYEGYHQYGGGCCEYVALAVCNGCGHPLAF